MKTTDRTLVLAKQIAEAALEKKAADVVILDLRKLETVTDFFVIATGDVDQQIRAIAGNIENNVRENLGDKVLHREGLEAANWVLLDYVDVVAHVFKPSFREFYRLEDLWSDAEVLAVPDEKALLTLSAAKGAKKKPAKKKTTLPRDVASPVGPIEGHDDDDVEAEARPASKKRAAAKSSVKTAKKASVKSPASKAKKSAAKKSAKTPARKSSAKSPAKTRSKSKP